MKETKFIEQNKEKWSEFETLLENKSKDPDRLSDLYVQLTDDLSYSKTYYKNRLVRAYLNNISQKVYLSIYKTKKTPINKIAYFWTEELPFIVYQCRKELLASFIIFFLAAAIGALSVLNDPSYAELVTSPSYVSMTKENIKNGDPMAVYKDADSLNMFLRIAWNNLMVSFNVFALGALACVGSIFMLLMNGTMLGGFQFFFWNKGVFTESVITIWQHGTIEILCIVIAGGAGIVLGKGLISPGSYPRLQSFQIAARKGLLIMLSIIPFIVLAAFIEAYITRLTDAPMIFRIGMILFSLIIMSGYYVYMPYRKYKAGFDEKLKFEKPIESKDSTIILDKIKDASDIFADSFTLYTKNFSKFFLSALLLGLTYGAIHVYYMSANVVYYDLYDFWNSFELIFESTFQKLFVFFKHSDQLLVFLINVAMTVTIIFMSSRVILKELKEYKFNLKTTSRLLLSSFFVAILINLMFFLETGLMYILFAVIIPFASIFNISVNANKSIGNGIQQGFSFMFTKFFDTLVLWVMLVAIIFLFTLINTSTLLAWLIEFVQQNFIMDGQTTQQFYTFISGFIGVSIFCLIYPIFYIAFGLKYFSNEEVKTAKHLHAKINQLVS